MLCKVSVLYWSDGSFFGPVLGDSDETETDARVSGGRTLMFDCQQRNGKRWHCTIYWNSNDVMLTVAFILPSIFFTEK